VAVYLPANYDPAARYPVVLCFDGEHYRDVARLPELLDHAIANGRVPPLIAVFWHNRDAASRNTELTCSPDLELAIVDELWPWIESTFPVSPRPVDRILTGFSLGGLASLWLGAARPDVYGSVLAVSPSLWFAGGDYRVGPGTLTRRYATADALPGKVFIAVGSLETGGLERNGSDATMVELAWQFHNALDTNPTVDAQFREEPGGHDYVNVRRSTMAGLEALLR